MRDYPALEHLVLWAHSLIYTLLNSVVFWCSQHWHQSWTVLVTLLSPLCDALMHFCSYSLLLLGHPHLLSTIRNTITCHDTTMLLLLTTGPVCHLCVLDSVPFSLLEPPGILSLSLKGIGILAALTSEALQVAILLGAVALCYSLLNCCIFLCVWVDVLTAYGAVLGRKFFSL
jgi:hypothetical protein